VQYAAIRDEINSAIQQILDQTDFISGLAIKEFEQHFSDYCKTKGTVGVASGTTAIHLALIACGIGKGDEVITTAHTFAATGEAIVHAGAIPVFVDIDPLTYLIDSSLVDAAITPKSKAILPVHLYGLSADMDSLGDIAKRHNLWLIEDAAQAHGALFHGKPCGSLGDIACFSFYPGKNLGAYGDAGAVTSSNLDLLGKVRQLHDHGRSGKYTHEIIGYGERLDTLQAAILDVKLNYLENWNTQRRAHAAFYSDLLADIDVTLPFIPEGLTHIFHQYVIRVPKRDSLREYLKAQGIETGIHYPIPLHRQPAFEKLGLDQVVLPQTDKCVEEIISLPIYPEMTENQIEFVVDRIKDFYILK
jgi:dTDP-4-amino-4,6-dideoxygalactose transaminase